MRAPIMVNRADGNGTGDGSASSTGGATSSNSSQGGNSFTNTNSHTALTLTTPTNPPTSLTSSPTSSASSTASSTKPGQLQDGDGGPITTSQKRAIIAGSAGGFVFALLLILGAVFWYRRRKKSQYEFLDALAAPTQRQHSRAMLLAGEDMDDDGAGAGVGVSTARPLSGGESIGMRSLHSPHPSRTATTPSTGTPLTPHQTPWDASDPRESIEALHHPSRAAATATPSAARAYMSQYLARAGSGSESGSVFREQLDDGDGGGYRDEDDGVEGGDLAGRGMGWGTAGAGEGHARNLSTASEEPLMAGGSHPPPYMPNASQTSLPARPSPLARRSDDGDGRSRTQNWIERTLAR
ncbi:hypothetical protein HWV62_27158 [Athelia sp. TMB]|nr:hypothetical protein HWV62_27158 [Athelia sp. TMB]